MGARVPSRRSPSSPSLSTARVYAVGCEAVKPSGRELRVESSRSGSQNSRVTNRRALIWMGITTVLGAVLAFVPLFDVLGFELSFAVGLVASFGAADLAAA